MFSAWEAAEREGQTLDETTTWDVKKSSGDFETDLKEICTTVFSCATHPFLKSDQTSTVRCSHYIVDPISTQASLLALTARKTIHSLNLNGCALSDVSLNLLRTALPQTSITHLAVDYNGGGTAEALCNLASIDSLTSLSLRGNQLGAENILTLCGVLKTKTNTIKSLSLYRNGIGDLGARKISRLLRENKTLKNISLSANGITSLGLKELLTGLTRYTLDQEGVDARVVLSGAVVGGEVEGGGKKKKKGKKKETGGASKLDEILSGGVCAKDEAGNDIEGTAVAGVGTVCRGNMELVCLDLSYNVDIGKNATDSLNVLSTTLQKEDLLVGQLNTLVLMGCGFEEGEKMAIDLLKEVGVERGSVNEK
jgi:hypothetical protein